MTSLPKRGDRVRVTAVPACCPTRKHYLGEEYVLANDAVMHPIHPGYCAFSPEPEGWVSPVKVEILERARTAHELGYLCKVCSGPCRAAIPNGPHPPPVVSIDAALRAEFARGMRRAVEIARELEAELGQYDWFSVGELRDAVEKELK